MTPEWTGTIDRVVIGATKADGGTRKISYSVGGDTDFPFTAFGDNRPLIALEIADDIYAWPPVALEPLGKAAEDPKAWAKSAETDWGADLVRLNLTSTHRRGFTEFSAISRTVEDVLGSTALPLIIEGSNDPSIDSEVFQKCGEAGEGERLLLGTAEADRYRSVAAAALAYSHSIIAQSPIDINLAKQLNILLREIGMPHNCIVIDPYTGALGYGFEYSFSVMERIRFAALKGDRDLAMPMISAATDSLGVKEVREAPQTDRSEIAVAWEFSAALAAAFAGAAIVCVRHPDTVKKLRTAFDALGQGGTAQ